MIRESMMQSKLQKGILKYLFNKRIYEVIEINF